MSKYQLLLKINSKAELKPMPVRERELCQQVKINGGYQLIKLPLAERRASTRAHYALETCISRRYGIVRRKDDEEGGVES